MKLITFLTQPRNRGREARFLFLNLDEYGRSTVEIEKANPNSQRYKVLYGACAEYVVPIAAKEWQKLYEHIIFAEVPITQLNFCTNLDLNGNSMQLEFHPMEGTFEYGYYVRIPNRADDVVLSRAALRRLAEILKYIGYKEVTQ